MKLIRSIRVWLRCLASDDAFALHLLDILRDLLNLDRRPTITVLCFVEVFVLRLDELTARQRELLNEEERS